MLFGNNIPPKIKNKLIDAHFRALEEEQEALENEALDAHKTSDFKLKIL